MPILAGPQTGAGPSPGPGLSLWPTPTATWYAPDGSVWPLANAALGWKTLRDVAGIDAPPVGLTTDPHPRGGARVRHVQPQPRIITWPLYVRGRTPQEIETRWRDVVDAFAQTGELGPGVLEVDRPGGGGARQISAYYQDGAEDDLRTPGKRLAVLSLYCEDPYWRATTPTTIYREQGVGVDFLEPYPSVSSSQVLGATTLHNPGNVIAWPEWVITGPASAITATLESTGESWTLTPADISAAFSAGDEIHISTDPPRVRYLPTGGGAAQVWTGALDWPGAVLWGLPRGSSDVTFTVAGADTTTSITLTFHARYRTS